MCWPFLTDVISCPMWSDNTLGPESDSRLCLGGQRSPFSFKVIQMIPVSSWVRDSSFIIMVGTHSGNWLHASKCKNLDPAHFYIQNKTTSWCRNLSVTSVTTVELIMNNRFIFSSLSVCIVQRLSQMTPALPSPKLILAGSAHPTPPLWEAVCWPISANQDMTSVALISSPASGISPGAAVHLHVLKVRQVVGHKHSTEKPLLRLNRS